MKAFDVHMLEGGAHELIGATFITSLDAGKHYATDFSSASGNNYQQVRSMESCWWHHSVQSQVRHYTRRKYMFHFGQIIFSSNI